MVWIRLRTRILRALSFICLSKWLFRTYIVVKLTIESTIIGTIGKGLLSVSPDGAKALGMGGLSDSPGNPVSSSSSPLHNDSLLGLRALPPNDNLGRVGVVVSAARGPKGLSKGDSASSFVFPWPVECVLLKLGVDIV